MQPTWSIVWRLRNLSLFRPLHLSPLSVETVSMWGRRSASQVDPGQSTGRRHPTGLKSSLHFFSLHTDSFCVLKLHFTSWWFKKHIPPFLFSLTVLLCIGYWLLQLIMRCFRFMVEHDEQQGNRFPFQQKRRRPGWRCNSRWWASGWLMVPLGAARGMHNSPNWHLEAVPARENIG